MNDEPKKGHHVYNVYAVLAFVGGIASMSIALIALTRLTQISDGGLWAIAAMVAAPSGMAVGVAAFVYKTSIVRVDASRVSQNG